MTEIKHGWKCPLCGTLHAPWVEQCTRYGCSSMPSPPIYGYAGTITIGGSFSSAGWAGGTVFCTPHKSESTQARETVTSWLDKGFSAKTLIIAAIDALERGDEGDNDD